MVRHVTGLSIQNATSYELATYRTKRNIASIGRIMRYTSLVNKITLSTHNLISKNADHETFSRNCYSLTSQTNNFITHESFHPRNASNKSYVSDISSIDPLDNSISNQGYKSEIIFTFAK